MDLLAFDAASYKPGQGGVVKLGNIPYSITKDEVIHYMGRAPGILQRPYECGIHIIMERPTAKTMDCYVEFHRQEEAVAFVKKHEYENHGKKRLGNRQVYVDLVDQQELLRELWPRAKCIIWSDSDPHRVENEDEYSTGFQGFFTTEEMVGMVRAAENPQRSPFSQKCIQRTYECMISSLHKFPWHVTSLYTLGDRNALFTAYSTQLSVLLKKVTQHQIVNLDHKLLTDFINAGMLCAGFSQRQKAFILFCCQMASLHQWPVVPTAEAWPFDVLSWIKGTDPKYVEFSIARFDLGTRILMERDRIPAYIEAFRNPNPPYNLLFNFEPSPTTQSINFETAFTIEYRFCSDILQAVQGHENAMFIMPGMPQLIEQLSTNSLTGLVTATGQGVIDEQKANELKDRENMTRTESPRRANLIFDPNSMDGHGYGHDTGTQNNMHEFVGYNAYAPECGTMSLPAAYPQTLPFSGTSQNNDNNYSYGQGYGYGIPSIESANATANQLAQSYKPKQQVTSAPRRVNFEPCGAERIRKRILEKRKSSEENPAGSQPRPEPLKLNTDIDSTSPTSAPYSTATSTTESTTPNQVSSSILEGQRYGPVGSPTAAGTHQRRKSELSSQSSVPNSATKANTNPPVSTPLATGPTIWTPSPIGTAPDWKMPVTAGGNTTTIGSGGFSSSTNTATTANTNATSASLLTSQRLNSSTISASPEDSPTLGKGRHGRGLSGGNVAPARDRDREALMATIMNIATKQPKEDASSGGNGGTGHTRRISTTTKRSSMRESSIAEEPEDQGQDQHHSVIGHESLGARRDGSGSSGGNGSAGHLGGGWTTVSGK